MLIKIWESEFVQAIRRLLEGGAFLALFLLIESGLVSLARITLHGETGS